MNKPLITDVDKNGTLEVICADNEVFCLSGKNAEVIWRYPLGGYVSTIPFLADIDGDSLDDVVMASGDVAWALRGSDGNLLWKFSQGQPYYRQGQISHTNLVSGNFNNDNIKDFLVHMPSGFFCLDGASGRILWQQGEKVIPSNSPISISDIDHDGVDEVIVCPYSDKNLIVRVLSGLDGSKLYDEFTVPHEKDYSASSLAGDFNADGQEECVFVMGRGKVFQLDGRNGRKIWETLIFADDGLRYTSSSFAVDLDGNSEDEILVCSRNKGLFVLDGNTGKIEHAVPFDFGRVFDEAAFLDYDDDGYLDVVFCEESRLIVISLKKNGAILDKFAPKVKQGLISTSIPAIGDIDNDGNLEIVVAIGSFMNAFKTTKHIKQGGER